jgi:CRP-like cAMP-binding protein
MDLPNQGNVITWSLISTGDIMKSCFSPVSAVHKQNLLLAVLGADVQARLFQHLTLVHLPLGKVLHESGDVMPYAYFPTDAIVALLYSMRDGTSVGISTVGNEGVVGVSLFMGGESTPSRAIVQGAGSAFRLSAPLLKEEFNRHGELLALMLRYTQAFITEMAQTAVCNRHHSVEQQLCRWLLLWLDRAQDNRLTMTEELIATMLGVRREVAGNAANKLQKTGAIEHARGQITVKSRYQLELSCCECYQVVKTENSRLLKNFVYRRTLESA